MIKSLVIVTKENIFWMRNFSFVFFNRQNSHTLCMWVSNMGTNNTKNSKEA